MADGHSLTLGRRFWSKVNKTETCWLWTGAGAPGYGRFKVDGRMDGTHRISLEAKLGRKLMSGMQALHTCDNPRCVRPDHLFEGTQSQNILDAYSKGRLVAKKVPQPGEENPSSKLTERDVIRVRILREAGFMLREIASVFNVTKQMIWRIVHGKNWTHV